MRSARLLTWLAFSSACAQRAPVADSRWTIPDVEAAPVVSTSGDGVELTSGSGLGRPCETLAIVDLHSQAGDEATGFEELRHWATTMGADAIVEAHYEAATGDEPAHVSGIMVRFKAIDPRPYDVLAQVEVRTEENEPNKGLAALRDKARELGADKVVDVRFHHSEDGLSRLQGLAVRYRR